MAAKRTEKRGVKKERKITADTTKIIKDAVKKGRVVFGTNAVMRGVKRGTLECVVYANNCPTGSIADLLHNAKIAGIEIRAFNGNSVALGELCGKPFSVLMVGITIG